MMSSQTFAGETGSRTVEQVAERHPGLVTVGRLGWVAKGVVYALVGALAIPIALQGGPEARANEDQQEQASQLGAVSKIADTSFGVPLLYVIAIGLLIYAAWRLVTIALPAENSAKAWATRVGYSISAAIYAALGWTAISFARRGSSSGAQTEDSRVERFTRDVMEHSAGRWLVGVVGVVIIAVSLFFVVKGITASFRDELEPRDVGAIGHESIVALGRIGWVGRGVATGLVGWLLIRSAVHFRPDEAKGIDGALRDVTGSSLGSILVGFAAIALVLYGAFCIVSAPRQRLKSAD
jgi:hypothetical protein